MKVPVILLLSLLLLASCESKKPSMVTLPDPKIEVDGSSNGLFNLGASVFDDGSGCIYRVLMDYGDILDKEPLPAKEKHEVSVSFEKEFEVKGLLGYLNADGNPLPKPKGLVQMWYFVEVPKPMFERYEVDIETDLSKGYFDLSGIEHPEGASFILLGISFYSRFYGSGEALFYAHLS